MIRNQGRQREMFRKATLIGIGGHIGLVVTGFMVLAGKSDLPALARIPAMVSMCLWCVILFLAMLVAHRAWAGSSSLRRFGLFILALPGWTLGLPLILLYLLQSDHDAGDFSIDA